MSKQPKYGSESERIGDAFAGFLDSIARFLFWGGIAVTALAIAVLIIQLNASSGYSASFSAAQANSNIDLFGKVLFAGVCSLFVGATYMFWGEEVLPALLIIGSLILYFVPPMVPGMMGNTMPNQVGQRAVGTIQTGGLILGLLSIACLVADLVTRARLRVRQGAKADQLKYGKGHKEEKDIRNVFMGSCWELPFCRKFVRERCPIYHARRTCWRERVGCMCEEQVIRDAMEGKAIPRDAVAAAEYIPVNNKLTPLQKFERCKSCVIYNEHQKHKYKLALPLTVLAFTGIYLLVRSFGMGAIKGLIEGMDRMVGKVMFTGGGNVQERIAQSSVPFHEIVLVCIMIIAMTYALKIMEYLIFKAKI